MSNPYFGGNGQAKPQYFDPLGPNAAGSTKSPTGGPEWRNSIFGSMAGDQSGINSGPQNFVTGLNSAASNPAWGNMQSYVNSVLNGNYLNGSPQLDAAMSAMRGASGAQAQDAAANVRSQFAQNGMSFGTSNQEAQGNATTAANAAADQSEAQARAQNYEQERQNQMAAPGEMENVISGPINYLQAVPQAYLAPLSSEGQIVQGLSGGGPIATATPYQTQGIAGQLTSSL